MAHGNDDHDCTGCDALQGRRAFLRDAGLAVAAALVAVGGAPRAALAQPLAFTEALEGRDAAGGMKSYAIPAADGATIDRDNDVILVRWQGAVYAFALSCPHQNTALRWVAGDARFQCPKHKSKYQPDGKFISGRATRGMDRLPIRREGANVVVDVDHVLREDEQAALYQTALVRL